MPSFSIPHPVRGEYSMESALIGYSGFVGSTLMKQNQFSCLYRSTNIGEIKHKKFGTVVCAGAPAQKWLANKDPEGDRASIEALIECLKTIECSQFILISTVDVFKTPEGVDEHSPVVENGLHAYGQHRRMLEKFVADHFGSHLIVRLPGLVGPGLRKNIIFDFLNKNNLSAIESRNVFQFYPMVNLWADIEIAAANNLRLVHFTAEPISVAEISAAGFGRDFHQVLSSPLLNYDMRSVHAPLFGGTGNYQYCRRETIQAVRHYAQSEPAVVGEVARS